MMRLAFASMRSRRTSFIATFLSIFLGATLIGSFATLIQTAIGDVPDVDRESLITIGAVVGSWGMVIVLFSVASTLTLTVRQRSGEMAMLRATGATPRQTRRMLRAETLLVTLAAVGAALVPGWLVSRMIFTMLQSSGTVSDAVEQSDGLAALLVAGAVITVVAYAATSLSSRRAAKMSVRRAQTESATDQPRMTKKRIGAGIVLLLIAIQYSVLTVTVMKDDPDPMAAMSTAGPAGVFAALGLAVLAPLLMRLTAAVLGRVVGLLGAAGHLAAYDARARSHQLAGVLSPMTVFVAIGTGTLYLVGIDNAYSTAPDTADTRNVELLNYIVVGMISVFAAIMIVNTVVAVISGRRRELAQQRLGGATPRQIHQVMLLESLLIAVTSTFWGAVAALATVLPYSWVKSGGLVPDLGAGTFVAVVAVALAVILTSTHLALRQAMRPPAVALAA